MNVLGILGSPRVGGNSDILLEAALTGAVDAGARVEKIVLSQKKIAGCYACERCNKTGRCVIKDDMSAIQKKILESDALIHSVPVYFWAMTAHMKAYLDRWCSFFDAEWKWHKHYYTNMKGKKIGLITVCGDPDASTANPIVHSFRMTARFANLTWLGVVRASAAAKGEIAKDVRAQKKAYELGRKAATL